MPRTIVKKRASKYNYYSLSKYDLVFYNHILFRVGKSNGRAGRSSGSGCVAISQTGKPIGKNKYEHYVAAHKLSLFKAASDPCHYEPKEIVETATELGVPKRVKRTFETHAGSYVHVLEREDGSEENALGHTIRPCHVTFVSAARRAARAARAARDARAAPAGEARHAVVARAAPAILAPRAVPGGRGPRLVSAAAVADDDVDARAVGGGDGSEAAPVVVEKEGGGAVRADQVEGNMDAEAAGAA